MTGARNTHTPLPFPFARLRLLPSTDGFDVMAVKPDWFETLPEDPSAACGAVMDAATEGRGGMLLDGALPVAFVTRMMVPALVSPIHGPLPTVVMDHVSARFMCNEGVAVTLRGTVYCRSNEGVWRSVPPVWLSGSTLNRLRPLCCLFYESGDWVRLSCNDAPDGVPPPDFVTDWAEVDNATWAKAWDEMTVSCLAP